MSKISFDSDFKGYVFVGAAKGRFEAEEKDAAGSTVKVMKDYTHVFVISPVSGYTSEDYSAFGFKAEKLRCVSPDVYEGFNVGDPVKLLFDGKGKVAMMVLDG